MGPTGLVLLPWLRLETSSEHSRAFSLALSPLLSSLLLLLLENFLLLFDKGSALRMESNLELPGGRWDPQAEGFSLPRLSFSGCGNRGFS